MSCTFEKEISRATSVVEQRIEEHRAGQFAPFSAKLLIEVREELRRMAQDSRYKPRYPRFLLDWPDETGLKAMLMDLAYRFDRSKEKG